jgi:glycine cleavage system H protein
VESVLEGRVDKFIFKVPVTYLFHGGETWIRAENETVVVGVSDFLQTTGGDVSFVELPDPGQVLEQGEQMGSLETIKAVLSLLSPLSGKVIRINEELREKPELINEEPYGAGWLLEMGPTKWDEEMMNLLPARDYFARMMGKARAEMTRLQGE